MAMKSSFSNNLFKKFHLDCKYNRFSYLKSSPFITLYLGSIGNDCDLSESRYKGKEL